MVRMTVDFQFVKGIANREQPETQRGFLAPPEINTGVILLGLTENLWKQWVPGYLDAKNRLCIYPRSWQDP